ncbi:MAG TPA: Na/Pi cotransporter family protein [Caulobacteraceae bacterium]
MIIGITLTLLDLAGAVALLLWGVHMVQSGVQRAFGAGLRRALSHALRNRAQAFFTGLGVTAVLQSSTATGLMVAGFASEGLVALPAALAVMLGANVGTTLIVQVMSFDVVIIAPVLILVGVVLFRRADAGLRDFGRVLIGLGFVLMALHQFITLLGPLTANALIRELLAALSPHIIFLVLVGAVLTWAAHSSVAVVLLAMSLAADAVVPLPAAIGLALGANLGSAINPVLERSGGRDPAGARLAVGNLLNRSLGVILVLAAFPYVTPLLSAVETAPARAVANFHTAFNLILAALFFPWLGAYAKLLERLLKPKAAEELPGAPIYLEPALRDNPSDALAAAAREALRMADVVEQMLVGLRLALIKTDRRQIGETKRLDDILDRLNRAIKEYVMSIAPQQLTAADSRALARILSFSISLERAGDLIDRNLLGIVNRRLKRGLSFSVEGQADLVALVDRLIANARSAGALFLSGDERAAHALAGEKAAFRDIEEQATAAHFERLRTGNVESVETSALHLDALSDLKRVNAYLVEAAAYPILRQRGELGLTRVKGRGAEHQDA